MIPPLKPVSVAVPKDSSGAVPKDSSRASKTTKSSTLGNAATQNNAEGADSIFSKIL